MFHRISTTILLSLVLFIGLKAQNTDKTAFTIVKQIESTEVKNQGNTGTCWSFATTSFLEAEVARMGKTPVDLSEMFFVRCAYLRKAMQYVDAEGNRFSEGGLSHDVMYVVENFGILPEASYTGLLNGKTKHNHAELQQILKAIADVAKKSNDKKLSAPAYQTFTAALDNYLGQVPAMFSIEGTTYSPQHFATDYLGIKPSDYMEFTSFTHSPFYKKFTLTIPDNWMNAQYYNLPIDELIEVMDTAITKGYTIAWDGDVSENEFNHDKGVAMYEKDEKISQKKRQETFEDETTTDDHLMHITGIAKDSKGNKYYITKNSWGTDSNLYNGYLYMSEDYVRLKTIGIMIHKDVIPKKIAKKLE